ncbi:MAG: pilus assembly protein PilM [Deltaproteobacteria bacterium]|nr:pilus assembly protein PilM [Deltaproteobacteria bacterium]
MSRIITAIEIFRDALYGVEIGVQRKQVEILRLIEEPLRKDALTSEGLSLFFTEHQLHKEEVITSVSGDMLITRRVSVPFRDRGRINKILPFELEPLVPFPLSELEICYRVLEQDRDRSNLLVYSLPKKVLDQRSSLFADAGIPLQMIGVSSLAAANALFTLKQIEKSKTILHLHVLPDFSILSIYRMGVLQHFVNLTWGGQDLTNKLTSITGLNVETLPERFSSLTPTEKDEITRALSGGETEIASQIRKECNLYLMQPQTSMPETLYVTGYTTGLPLLIPLLEKAVEVRAKTPDPLPALKHSLAEGTPGTGLPAPLGLAFMWMGKDALGSVFRRQKTSFFSSIINSKQELRHALIIVAILIVGFFTDFFVGIQAKEYHYHRLQQEMRLLFHETFPDVKNIVNELEQMKLKMKDLEKQNEIFKTVFGEKPSALEVLNELSVRIPKDIELAITDFTIDDKSIRFTGWTDTFESVNKIEKELRKSTIFVNAKVSNAKVGRNKSRINFQILIPFKK